ncbi:MAG: LCP family protein [Treponema sp.]|nr:LCP family protein [Spirochaetaceae bacterium]MCI6663047.1 LCP family protein [Spirochaetia bacterium]MDD7274558.1 LCP family protein [Treponema sp.]MDY3755488.1 LCP family protein [Treponema sp.]
MRRKRAGGLEKSMIFLFLVFSIIIVTSLIVVSALQVNPVEEMIKNEEPIKILFVLEDDEKVLFTDVFIYYPVSGRGALFNIPGNTGAIYSSLGRVDRIDMVYREKGIDAYRQEIEKLSGQSIPFSMVCSVDNFKVLTDLLGGLKIFVPYPVDIQADNGSRWLLPSGVNNLDGDKILTYLYYNSPEETDGEVQDRYQNVIIAFLAAINKNINTMFLEKNFKEYDDLFETNLEEKDLRIILETVAHVDSERLAPRSITGSVREVDGKSLLFPHYDGELVKDLFKQTVSSLVSVVETIYDRIYVLEVQNGTSVQGLARNTSILLQGFGFDVLSSVNADRNDYEETIIINHIGNDEIAKNLGDIISCSNIITEDVLPESAGMEAESRVDFTIILGKDFDGRYVR